MRYKPAGQKAIPRRRRFVPLRLRLAFWTSGLFVVLCLGLITFMNLAQSVTGSHQLLLISLISFLFVTVSGGIGAYWISGIALRPVKEMSGAATLIHATTLSTRLDVAGPQDELKELAEAFDAMLDRLEKAFEQQSRFVADAAHELCTPLATLRINLDVMRRNPRTTLDDYLKLFATVERAVIRLEHLVAALLLLATEEQAIVQEDVLLVPLLEEVLSALQPTAESHQITLHLEAEMTASLSGDSHLLAQVFRNLVENGIRYNVAGGSVTMTLNETPVSVTIGVIDTGIGIAPEEQEHIFERFYRVDHSRTRHRGGAGLGLSIVQHLLSLHNGSIFLANSSPAGSTFLVHLPIVPPIRLRAKAQETEC